MSSNVYSDVLLPPTFKNQNMSKTTNNKVTWKLTFNMEGMSSEEQMMFLIHLADIGLLPPCPTEIRSQYAKPANK